MRFWQLVYQLYYRLTKKLQAPAKKHHFKPIENTNVSLATAELSTEEKAVFSFLNIAHDFGTIDAIDWNLATYGKLWTYNLNYFDFIRDEKQVTNQTLALIDDWIKKGATHKDGWEPYPMSLRIMNWLGFFRDRFQGNVPIHVQQSLYDQYQDLWQKREYHLMGNHLLENAIALCRAAHFFQDSKGLSKAFRLLFTELKEQYRPEGAHFELSGMYHCILLQRLLELYEACAVSNQESGFDANLATSLAKLKKSIEKQVGWLHYLIDAKGYYPHFNDSVDGIAPSPLYLLEWAKKLEIEADIFDPSITPAHYRSSFGNFDLWVDLGPIAPDYIPGHGHADNLTFCLNYNQQPIVVDMGISTYEKNFRRLEERETSSHNTVCISGKDSSEIWGGFRCGRRAKTTVTDISPQQITATHNGFEQWGVTHERTFCWDAKQLHIKDNIAKKGVAKFHFHPDLEPQYDDQNRLIVGPLEIKIKGESLSELQPYEYALGFNNRTTAWLLAIDFEQALEVKFQINT